MWLTLGRRRRTNSRRGGGTFCLSVEEGGGGDLKAADSDANWGKCCRVDWDMAVAAVRC